MSDDRYTRTTVRVWPLVAIAAVLAIASLSGCYYPEGDGVSVTFQGSVNETDSGIAIDGNLSSYDNSEQETFEDVRVVMYDDQGNVLRSERVGDLDVETGRLRVNVSASERPEYVTFESEDFWDEPKIEVEYVYRTEDGEYGWDEATERSELPGH